LLADLGKRLTDSAQVHEFMIPAGDGQRLAWLHAHGEVLVDEDGGEGPDGAQRHVTVRLAPKEFGRYEALGA